MESPTTIPGSGPSTSGSTQGPGIPNPELADLIRRKAAGEKLSSQEYGKLGGYYRRRAPSAAPPPTAGPSRVELLRAAGAVDPIQAPVDLQSPPPVDPELVRRTTDAILKAIDGVCCRWIESEARKAGADQSSVALIVDQAKLQDSQKSVMVETSPIILESLGVDSSNYPIAAFLAGLGTWALGLFGAVSGLRRIQQENQQHARDSQRSNVNHPVQN